MYIIVYGYKIVLQSLFIQLNWNFMPIDYSLPISPPSQPLETITPLFNSMNLINYFRFWL